MASRTLVRSSGPLGAGLFLALLAAVACDPAAGGEGSIGPQDATPSACEDADADAPVVIAGRTLAELAELALSGDEATRAEAIAALRQAGPAGLDAFVGVHQAALAAPLPVVQAADGGSAQDAGRLGGLVNTWLGGPSAPASTSATGPVGSAGLDAALDAICRQHGCRHTQLYWYTELDEALVAARASGKPVLSLRLLGQLDEALSCANSRFFRTILYPAVAPWLRERFVLHWSSERPVPVVTVDYGDGRQLTRTITGNSVHYVLDADGRPVDALPGLLAPPVFQRLLERSAALALAAHGRKGWERATLLSEHHTQRLADLDVVWGAELRAIGEDPSGTRPPIGPLRGAVLPDVAAINVMAFGKSKVEMPLLDGMGLGPGLAAPTVDLRFWDRLAARHIDESQLARASLRAMSSIEPVDAEMRAAAVRSLAIDTLVNEHQLHRTVHQWFAEGSAGALSFEALNRRIYDELLLTPQSDRTLGLAPEDVYSGIAGGGWSTPPVGAGASRVTLTGGR